MHPLRARSLWSTLWPQREKVISVTVHSKHGVCSRFKLIKTHDYGVPLYVYLASNSFSDWIIPIARDYITIASVQRSVHYSVGADRPRQCVKGFKPSRVCTTRGVVAQHRKSIIKCIIFLLITPLLSVRPFEYRKSVCAVWHLSFPSTFSFLGAFVCCVLHQSECVCVEFGICSKPKKRSKYGREGQSICISGVIKTETNHEEKLINQSRHWWWWWW